MSLRFLFLLLWKLELSSPADIAFKLFVHTDLTWNVFRIGKNNKKFHFNARCWGSSLQKIAMLLYAEIWETP